MTAVLLTLAQATTEPVGQTPAERVLIYAIGAAVTVALAWIAYLSAGRKEVKERQDRQGQDIRELNKEIGNVKREMPPTMPQVFTAPVPRPPMPPPPHHSTEQ